MNVKINLLPQEKKQEIRRKKIIHSIVKWEAAFLLPIFFIVLVLFGINLAFLKIYLLGVDSIISDNKFSTSYSEMKSYESEFSTTNKKVNKITQIKEASVDWVVVLGEIEKNMPHGIIVNELKTNKNSVFVSGKADSRDDILFFRDNIKKAGCFSDIDLPLSNLVSKENVDFNISFNINRDCL